jgi:hypothetical protein
LKIDGILTSYKRHDLLYKTLRSIKLFMADEIQNLFVVEDSDQTNSFLEACSEFLDFVYPIPMGIHLGHVYCIDHAMGKVNSEYFFHGEDDFECVKSGFISEAVSILERDEQILEVNGRGRIRSAVNGHPIGEDGILSKDYHGWTGKMWSPCVGRMSEYKKLVRYSNHISFDPTRPYLAEKEVGKLMMKGFKGARVTDDAYFIHTGENRSTINFGKQ